MRSPERPARNLGIISEPHAGQGAVSFVREALARFNVAATGEPFYGPFANLLRGARGSLLGGASWGVRGEWPGPTFLRVAAPLRGQGCGERLLRAAEKEVRSLGCRGVFLSTFSFQARPFCERFGYEVSGELPDYPTGHAYHFMIKALDDAETD